MERRPQIHTTVPDHVREVIERRAMVLGTTKAEYLAGIARWWYGRGCPPINPEEAHFLQGKGIDVWNLNAAETYMAGDDDVVTGLIAQLNSPALSAVTKAPAVVAFDNHPTHWISLYFSPSGKGKTTRSIFFHARPKSSVSRAWILHEMQTHATEKRQKEPFAFSQLTIPRTA